MAADWAHPDAAPTGEAAGVSWGGVLARRSGRIHASEIRELLKLVDRPEIISFAGGIPDPALFPEAEIGRALSEIMGSPSDAGSALQYSVSEGYLPLREWIVEHMGRRGVRCDPAHILITSGSQQGLDFLGKLFVQAPDTALVSRPTYLGALQALGPYEPYFDTLELSADGFSAARYQAAAADRGGRVCAAYVVTEHANPTGETLPVDKRLRLLDLGRDLDVPIIEDAAYEALTYEGACPPALLALDGERNGGIDRSRVVYCGTFSKTVSPGLRVGWICASREVIARLVLIKQGADLHSASLNQMVMNLVVRRHYQEQVNRIIPVYAGRRDALLKALQVHMPAGASWTSPAGGMFVWVTLPERLDASELLQRAIRVENVAFVPGRAFFHDGSGSNTLRLNFSLQGEGRIEEGIARLGRLIATQLRDGR